MSERVKQVAQALLAMPRKSWEQGVAAQAFLEWGELSLADELVREAIRYQAPDGRLAMREEEGSATDSSACGEALVSCYRRSQDSAQGEALRRQLEWLQKTAPCSAEGWLYHRIDNRQFWVDSMYMAPPFLAAAGELKDALHQAEGLWQRLWRPDIGLLGHIYDDASKSWVRQAAWASGNGWAAAGLARLLRHISGNEARNLWIQRLKPLIENCLRHQTPDGLFHDVLDDPATFIETNSAQMIASAIFRGLKDGWADPAWRSAAQKMRKAAWDKVDAQGLVQGASAAPTFDRPGSSPEAQAFFILMEAAARDAGEL